jgi:chromosome segregation ATPase
MTTPRPKGETLAEHVARLTDRIVDLTQELDGLRLDLAIRDDMIAGLAIQLAEADRELADLRRDNAELRQQIDLVIDREREGRERA